MYWRAKGWAGGRLCFLGACRLRCQRAPVESPVPGCNCGGAAGSAARFHAPLIAHGAVKAQQHAVDRGVPLAIVACCREGHGATGTQKIFERLNRTQSCFVPVDHPSWIINPRPGLPSGLPLQSHSSLDKAMRRLTFTETEAQALSHERFHHSHPRVRRKREALRLKSQGLVHQNIAQLVSVSEKTLRSYFQQYVDRGIAGLKKLHFRQPRGELVRHRESITTYFRAHPPTLMNEAVNAIRDLTGLTRSPTQVRLFLKEKCGMKRLKAGTLPAKADPEIQETF